MTERDDRQVESLMRDVHWDFDREMSYGEYLQLDKVLAAQRPLSGQHDEMLFIVIHQVYELWFKLLLHETDKLNRDLDSGELWGAVSTLQRMRHVLKTLVGQLDVLRP